ncbi:MAG: hypothetical protein M1822_000567 [Bathelium mastoideum]|nr:MAG: hypothetical protein M1822_000567 [Bathelium mastoideum]
MAILSQQIENGRSSIENGVAVKAAHNPNSLKPFTNGAPSYTVSETTLEDPGVRPLKVIGIGTGVSGIMMAYKIQKECTNVDLSIYERNADVGGTWLVNKYPMCGCDVPAHAYSFNFALNPDWPRYSSFREDVWTYLNRICKVFDLKKYMTFNTEVTRCKWDDASGKWHVTIKETGPDGETKISTQIGDILLHATGVLSNTKWPGIKGVEKFKGKLIHTSKWPDNYQKEEWAKDRIAVLGGGASSIQTVPGLQPYAKGLEVFIRNPVWFSTMLENDGWYKEYSEEQRQEWKSNPKALVDYVKSLERELDFAIPMMTVNSEAQKKAKEGFKQMMRQHIKDDRLFNGFIPEYGVGCRRMTPGGPYMKAVQEPNVHVNFTGAAELTEHGVIGEDGIERPVDAVVCATGFDTSFRPPFPVIGKDGIDLSEQWKDIPDAYFGLAAPNMPNWFTFMGPAFPCHNGSIMGSIIRVGDYVVKAIHKMQHDHIVSITPREDATAALNVHVQKWMERSVWADNCRSWFKNNKTGRVNALWSGSGIHYAAAIKDPRWEDFHIRYQTNNPFTYLGNGYTYTEYQEGADATPFLAEDLLDPKWVEEVFDKKPSQTV